MAMFTRTAQAPVLASQDGEQLALPPPAPVTWEDLVRQAQQMLDERLQGLGVQRQIVVVDPVVEAAEAATRAREIATLTEKHQLEVQGLHALYQQVVGERDRLAAEVVRLTQPIQVSVNATIPPAQCDVSLVFEGDGSRPTATYKIARPTGHTLSNGHDPS